MPESFMPPKGVLKSRWSHVLTHLQARTHAHAHTQAKEHRLRGWVTEGGGEKKLCTQKKHSQPDHAQGKEKAHTHTHTHTHTMPTSSSRATLCATLRFSVHTFAHRP